MKRPEKSPTLQEHERSLTLTQKLFKKAKALWSFGQLKTWKELYDLVGQDYYGYGEEQLLRKPTAKEIDELANTIADKSRCSFEELSNNRLQDCKPIEHTYEGYHFNPAKGNGNIKDREGNRILLATILSAQDGSEGLPKRFYSDEKGTKEEQERILTSSKQKAKLIHFQNRAGAALLDGILVSKKRCQLLRAATGAGKTYIIAAVLRQLMDIDLPRRYNNIAIWPFVWITRSTIVEQTKRVCQEQFGLDLDSEVLVVNIEQMRARFGELFLKEETIISFGEEHIKWKWHPNNGPLVFVIDESHLAKNEDSTQSKIIQSLSDIEKDIFVICVSATPFCRITEGKYFAVNSHMTLR